MKKPRDVRREDILSAAVNEFLEKGYQGASVDSIARRAGLTKGGVYHHFTSKDEILLAANEKFAEPEAVMMSKAELEPNPCKALSTFIADYIDYWAAHPKEIAFMFLSFTKLLSCPELWDLYRGYSQRMRSFASGLYRRGLETGVFQDLDPDNQGLALMAALEGVIGFIIMDASLSTGSVIRSFQRLFVSDLLALSNDAGGPTEQSGVHCPDKGAAGCPEQESHDGFAGSVDPSELMAKIRSRSTCCGVLRSSADCL